MARMEVTKAEAKREFVRCGTDPVYFINNYLSVVHPIRGNVSFKTYPFQNKLVRDFISKRFNIILKSRQLGISTITAAYILWLMLFHKEKMIVVLATKRRTSAEMIIKVKKMWRSLPSWFAEFTDIEEDNKNVFAFANGSRVVAEATSGNAGRGFAASLLVIDEAAHVEGLDELWKSIYPVLSEGGACIALSSPNGASAWFYETYTAAENRQNNFHPTKLPWTVHPERDKEWFEDQTKNMKPRDIAQEFLASFLTSGNTFIDFEYLKRITEEQLMEPMLYSGMDNNVWVWVEPEDGRTYVIACDVARGDGEDFSAFHIFDAGNKEQVAEYKGRLSWNDYAELIFHWGMKYNGALAVVEVNKLGYAVADTLVQMDYPNVYYVEKGPNQNYIDAHEAAARTDVVPGFTMTHPMREKILDKMEDYIRRNVIKIRSNRTLSELNTFVWKQTATGAKPVAAEGKNDDLVMPLALACWVIDTALMVNERALQYDKAIIEGMTVKRSAVISRGGGAVAGFDPKTLNIRFGPEGRTKEERQFRGILQKNGWIIK